MTSTQRLDTSGLSADDVRAYVEAHRDDSGGVECPSCGQLAKTYRRKLHSSMAAALLTAYRRHGREPFRIEYGEFGGDFAKLRYWGIISPASASTANGGRSGWWSITDYGVRFATQHARAQKYAVVYNDHLICLDGEPVTIEDCLGDKFDYSELLGPVELRRSA